jgi:hypothetical protein
VVVKQKEFGRESGAIVVPVYEEDLLGVQHSSPGHDGAKRIICGAGLNKLRLAALAPGLQEVLIHFAVYADWEICRRPASTPGVYASLLSSYT